MYDSSALKTQTCHAPLGRMPPKTGGKCAKSRRIYDMVGTSQGLPRGMHGYSTQSRSVEEAVQVRGGKLTPTLVSFLYVCYRRFAMQKPKVLAHTRRVEVVVDRNKKENGTGQETRGYGLGGKVTT